MKLNKNYRNRFIWSNNYNNKLKIKIFNINNYNNKIH